LLRGVFPYGPPAFDADPELIVLTVLAVLLYVGAAQGWPLSPVTPPYGTRWLACAGPGCWSAWVRWRLHWPLPAGLARHRPRGCRRRIAEPAAAVRAVAPPL
jgi:hypothetical protein